MGVGSCPDTQEGMFLFPYILKIPHETSECSVLFKKVTPAVVDQTVVLVGGVGSSYTWQGWFIADMRVILWKSPGELYC